MGGGAFSYERGAPVVGIYAWGSLKVVLTKPTFVRLIALSLPENQPPISGARREALQGYFIHNKTYPPRTLP